MEIYLVGGAIRDQLLGLPVIEQDWVVVGTTPDAMIALGYTPVGKEFPVFLHPKTHEEYALARTERKVAKGYKGFTFHAAPDVTLEEDLQRRDLTVNAMAQTEDGTLIDPCNGQQDLDAKLLRHVSAAFAEDPVRILRIARFACKLPGFTVCPDTNTLMQSMVDAGEVDALTAERVWKELERALQCVSPWRFFEVLQDSNALAVLFPELTDKAIAAAQLQSFCSHQTDSVIRFAGLCYHLTAKQVKAICQRYRVPNHYKALAQLVAEHKNTYQQINMQQANEILQLFKTTDAIRKPERFKDFLITCEQADNQVRHQQELSDALQHIQSVDTTSIQQSGVTGVEFAKALQQKQLETLQTWLDQ